MKSLINGGRMKALMSISQLNKGFSDLVQLEEVELEVTANFNEIAERKIHQMIAGGTFGLLKKEQKFAIVMVGINSELRFMFTYRLTRSGALCDEQSFGEPEYKRGKKLGITIPYN